MRRLLVAAGLVLTSWSLAVGADFDDQLRRGNDLLRQGDHAAALDIFQQLETQNPNSAEVQFGLGCAEYGRAVEAGEDADPAQVQQGLEAARKAFEKAATLGDAQMRVDAGYNRANALAQMAKRAGDGNDPEAMKRAFETSINTYESFLRQYPQHTLAHQNLDHMRYLLRRIQQQPPEQQQQGSDEQQGDQNQQESGEGQQQQQQNSERNQQQGESDEQQQQQNEQDDSQSQEDQNNSESEQGSDSQDEPDPTDSQAQQKAIIGDAPEGRENVEAILESLEERDNREQHQIRQGPRETRVRKEWW